MVEKYLEYTNLNEKANWKDIRDGVKEALELNCLGFCTYMHWSGVVDKTLKSLGKDLKKIYVIGFYTGSEKKINSDLFYIPFTKADEYDVVFPLAEYSTGNLDNVKNTLKKVRKATEGKTLKVIIETNVLRDLPEPEKKIIEVIKIAEEIGADIIKTNTGKFPRTIPIEEDIKLIKEHTKLPIKAAGQIYTYELAKKLIDLGVERIGSSRCKDIIIGEIK